MLEQISSSPFTAEAHTHPSQNPALDPSALNSSLPHPAGRCYNPSLGFYQVPTSNQYGGLPRMGPNLQTHTYDIPFPLSHISSTPFISSTHPQHCTPTHPLGILEQTGFTLSSAHPI